MVQHLQYGSAALCSRSLQGDVSDLLVSLWLLYLQSMLVSALGGASGRQREATIHASLLQLASSHNAKSQTGRHPTHDGM